MGNSRLGGGRETKPVEPCYFRMPKLQTGFRGGLWATVSGARALALQPFSEKYFQKRLVRNIPLVGEDLQIFDHRHRQAQ